ncbi:hypothetical protein chiPu_0030354 [Chiloscyllium punctatum]|uniref:Uncharacterized protein n=1 Tax=Chiloscyllium punctatum TaxID=137246 RepID=A0A401TV40_CHIPU|nr:hypothetical protein [Chiloscyllium punctatum]
MPQSCRGGKGQGLQLELSEDRGGIGDLSPLKKNGHLFLCPSQVTTSVEIVEEFNSLPIIIGSSIGGLVLLALMAGILYKVSGQHWGD